MLGAFIPDNNKDPLLYWDKDTDEYHRCTTWKELAKWGAESSSPFCLSDISLVSDLLQAKAALRNPSGSVFAIASLNAKKRQLLRKALLDAKEETMRAQLRVLVRKHVSEVRVLAMGKGVELCDMVARACEDVGGTLPGALGGVAAAARDRETV